MNNYINKTTGEEFFFPKHKTIFGSSGKIYTDNRGNELVDPDTGEKLVPIPKEGRPTIFKSENDKRRNYY